jgi:hypothetical protein
MCYLTIFLCGLISVQPKEDVEKMVIIYMKIHKPYINYKSLITLLYIWPHIKTQYKNLVILTLFFLTSTSRP